MATGRKQGFTRDELKALRAALELRADHLGLALLNTGVDTMLRLSDLRRLTVGAIAETMTVGQKKDAGAPVTVHLLPHTLAAVARYVQAYRLQDDDLLFGQSDNTLTGLVKGFARLLGRDPKAYGMHSLRRTKAAILAADCSAAELDDIRTLLGHKYLSSTQSYLGTSQASASALARKTIV